MHLRQIVDDLGLSQIALAREANLSRFRLYQFLWNDIDLKPEEEKALLKVLRQQAERARQAIQTLEKIHEA